MTDDTTQHDTDTDLSSFGGGVSFDPPRIKKDRPEKTVTGEGTVGYVGDSPDRSGRVFIATRNSDQHRLHYLHKEAGGSYAISIDVLNRLRAYENVSRVFIHELDTDTVYEWPLRAFRTPDDTQWREVPATFLETERDPQAYVARDSAEHAWDMRTRDLYISEGGFE